MTVKQAAMALTGQPAEIGEESKISVKLILTCIALFFSFVGIVWGFHLSAVNSIKESQKEGFAALRTERQEVLKQYPTWRDINDLRTDDRKYLDSQFNTLREEIRRSR